MFLQSLIAEAETTDTEVERFAVPPLLSFALFSLWHARCPLLRDVLVLSCLVLRFTAISLSWNGDGKWKMENGVLPAGGGQVERRSRSLALCPWPFTP